jgi:hypothetical protein
MPGRRSGYGPIDTLLDIPYAEYSADETSAAIEFAATNYEFHVYARGTYTGYVATTAEWVVKLLVSTDGSTFTDVGASFVALTGKLQHVCVDGETIRAAIKDTSAKVTHVKLMLDKVGSPGNFTGFVCIARDD